MLWFSPQLSAGTAEMHWLDSACHLCAINWTLGLEDLGGVIMLHEYFPGGGLYISEMPLNQQNHSNTMLLTIREKHNVGYLLLY